MEKVKRLHIIAGAFLGGYFDTLGNRWVFCDAILIGGYFDTVGGYFDTRQNAQSLITAGKNALFRIAVEDIE